MISVTRTRGRSPCGKAVTFMPFGRLVVCSPGRVKPISAAGAGGCSLFCACRIEAVRTSRPATLFANSAICGLPGHDGEDGPIGWPQVFFGGSQNHRGSHRAKLPFERIDVIRVVVEERVRGEQVRAPEPGLSA